MINWFSSLVFARPQHSLGHWLPVRQKRSVRFLGYLPCNERYNFPVFLVNSQLSSRDPVAAGWNKILWSRDIFFCEWQLKPLTNNKTVDRELWDFGVSLKDEEPACNNVLFWKTDYFMTLEEQMHINSFIHWINNKN